MIRRLVTLTVLCLILMSANLFSMVVDKVSPSLSERAIPAYEWVNVVAIVKTSALHTPAISSLMMKDARKDQGHAALIAMLKKQDVSNSSFVNRLRALEASGHAANITTYWIANAVSFSVEASQLDALTNADDLEYLLDDQPLELVEPVGQESSESGYAGSSSHMSQIGVRDLWDMGYTGHGRLVCSFDTGVEGTHPALAGNWKGVDVPSSQSWFDPYGTTTPVDNNGHGTHTMGLMVGRDAGDTIGVAFNAQWMSASVIDRGQSLNKTVSDIIAAFQWAADPDGNSETVSDLPDVVCNSWGIPKGLLAPCDATFWQAIDNLEALGVVVIFACGNEGPNAGTIRNPADRAAAFANSFSIGAVDQTRSDLLIASFSSRGPANCDNTRIKPELVAPGVSLRSSYRGGGYRQMSGTSMAAPVVAGCIALMREYNPDATVSEIKDALIQSATDLGSAGQDNDYGYGFINVKRALDFLPVPLKPRIHVEAVTLGGSTSAALQVGNTTELNLTISNTSVATSNLRGVLRSSNAHVFILTDEANFGSAPTAALVDNVANPFMVKIDHSASAGTMAEFTVDFFSQQFGYLNSADFKIVLGQPVIAGAVTIATNRISSEVTNFGMSRRLYDVAAAVDPLSLMSLVIADPNGEIYDALPDGLDYRAVDSLHQAQFGVESQVVTGFVTADDAYDIEMTATTFNEVMRSNFILLEYEVGLNTQNQLPKAVGLACDFDFADGEAIVMDGTDYIVRASGFDRYVGIRILPAANMFGAAVSGADFKAGTMLDADKYAMMTSGASTPNPNNADNALIAGVGPINASGASIHVGFVVASGNSIEEIRVALQAGQGAYEQATDVDDNDGSVLPEAFTLGQNFPNPFNPETRVDFSLSKAGSYRFEIFNALGQTVKVVDVVDAAAGPQNIVWNGTSNDGSRIASGVYFYKLTFDGNSQTRKMVFLK